MTIQLSVWTNIKDKDRATAIFEKLLDKSGFVLSESALYWKDKSKRVMTFHKKSDVNEDTIYNLLNALNLISTQWTLNTEGLCGNSIEVSGHSNDQFRHSSISFATVTSEPY